MIANYCGIFKARLKAKREACQNMNTIVLLKERKDPQDEYENLIRSYGMEVEFHQVLSAEYINQELLFDKFHRSPQYSALIVTSQKAGLSLGHAFQEFQYKGVIHPNWLLSIPVYCVGEATAAIMESIGFKKCLGRECGSAEELTDYILIHHQNPDQNCLFLTGDKTRSVIPDAFEGMSWKLDQLQVYQTRNTNIMPGVLDDKLVIVVFSPSGLDSLPELAQIKNARFIAIGPTTRKAIIDRGYDCIEAAAPNPKGVFEAIFNLITQDQSDPPDQSQD